MSARLRSIAKDTERIVVPRVTAGHGTGPAPSRTDA